ncbi:MAG: Transposase [Rhodospirillales bacterium]|nr:Transposase [Rhodospirillales bacterium]
MSAWAADQRLVLGQITVDDKSNEIVAVPKLLELLLLKGRTVTADAMSCQRKIAQQVIDQGGDYVLALKGNQETLHDDVRRFLDDPETELRSASEADKGHGRIETRTASVSTDIGWLQDSHDWPGLRAIGKITATREINGKTTTETRCYLLSQACAPERFNTVVRSHWGIENQLHWVLDLIMDEDQARNRKSTVPKTLPCSASSPSISPNWSPQKAPCAENSSEPGGTMLSSPKSSLCSLIFKCDSPAATPLTGGICLYI